MTRRGQFFVIACGLTAVLLAPGFCAGPQFVCAQIVCAQSSLCQIEVHCSSWLDLDAATESDEVVAARQLNCRGLPGLVELLDELLPDTAKPRPLDVPGETIARWIDELDDDSPAVREAAARRLTRLGPAAAPLLEPAAHDRSAERAQRAAGILRGWDDRVYADLSDYASVLEVYATMVHDDARLQEIADRVAAAARTNLWTESRAVVVAQLATLLVLADRPKYNDRLRDLLWQSPDDSAQVIAEGIANSLWRDRPRCPQLILDMLRSDRQEFVDRSLHMLSYCPEFQADERLRVALIELFERRDGEQQCEAGARLCEIFHYEPARDFLLRALRENEPDTDRLETAIGALRCQNDERTPPDPRLCDALQPLLKRREQMVRSLVIETLSTYDGERVVRMLAPLLADADHEIVVDVAEAFRAQQDCAAVRRVLDEVAQSTPSRRERLAIRGFLNEWATDEAEAENTWVPLGGGFF